MRNIGKTSMTSLVS